MTTGMSPDSSAAAQAPAARSGSLTLGAGTDDPMPVRRLGFGAMRVTGAGVWGPPADPGTAVAVLRRSVELGVDFVDTADSYGPFVSEDLIREALHPYEGVVVATKGGLLRTGPNAWHVLGDPNYLRQCVEMSLRRLDVERIDLWQLHRVDPRYPVADQLGVLSEMQQAGKIRHIGLSEVDVATLDEASGLVDPVSVQNIFNVGNRAHADVVAACEDRGIGFIPWFPIAGGDLVADGSPLTGLATQTGYSIAQLSLAWLLRLSPVMLPIPGTGSLTHLEENCSCVDVVLDDEQWASLDALG
jgi:aryl-alcohol dehydrogenase-like predicted oxidoreductase